MAAGRKSRSRDHRPRSLRRRPETRQNNPDRRGTPSARRRRRRSRRRRPRGSEPCWRSRRNETGESCAGTLSMAAGSPPPFCAGDRSARNSEPREPRVSTRLIRPFTRLDSLREISARREVLGRLCLRSRGIRPRLRNGVEPFVFGFAERRFSGRRSITISRDGFAVRPAGASISKASRATDVGSANHGRDQPDSPFTCRPAARGAMRAGVRVPTPLGFTAHAMHRQVTLVTSMHSA